MTQTNLAAYLLEWSELELQRRRTEESRLSLMRELDKVCRGKGAYEPPEPPAFDPQHSGIHGSEREDVK